MSDRVHGDMSEAALRAHGLEPQDVVDFAVNVSPFGPHPEVIAAARDADLSRYPERDGETARAALAHALDVPASCTALGNGAAELLFSAAHALIAPGDRCLVLGPTFGEARAAFEAARGEVVEHTTALDLEGSHDALLRDLNHAITRSEARALYLCDPNNPTGRLLGAARVRTLAEAHPRTRFLLDQAFLSLSTGHADARTRMPDNVLVLRSMTKDHALPGLRVAYLFGAHADVARIERVRPPWTTSASAQAAIPVALRHESHVSAARSALLALRVGLERGLRSLGLAPHPSQTPFLVCDVQNAEHVRAELLHRHGVLVRSCASFGLPRHIRLCSRPLPDQARLFRALEAVLPTTPEPPA